MGQEEAYTRNLKNVGKAHEGTYGEGGGRRDCLKAKQGGH